MSEEHHELCLAEDARLDRKIALKVLPVQFSQEADRARRFVRKAKAALAPQAPIPIPKRARSEYAELNA
jgi:hypothetical protein